MVREGYKQTEVGEIPDDWLVISLSQIGTPIIGLTYKPSDVVDFGILVLRSSNIQANLLAYDNNVYVDMEVPKRVIVKVGDLLVCVRNGSRDLIGKCAFIDKAAEGSAFGAFMSVFRSADSKYVFYQFQSHIVQGQINKIMGATINQITNKDMGAFKIPYPSDPEERSAIFEVLYDIDELIASLEKLIAKKQDIKTATMQQLLTGKKRLPGFGEGKGYKQTELGEIPEDWEEKVLGEVGSTYSGLIGKNKSDFGSGTAKYITFLNVITNVVIDPALFEKVKVSPSELQNKVFKGDLIFNGSSETPEEVAMCSIVADDVTDLYLNSFCFGFRPSDGVEIDRLFLVYYLRSNVGREMMKSLAQGSTRYNLSKTALLDSNVYLPSLNEQKSIASVLSDMDIEISTLEARWNKTKAIKQGMMQELLTGRTRLVDMCAVEQQQKRMHGT